MNVDRFRVDLQSNAIVEAFGTDLDVARAEAAPRWEVEGRAAPDVLAAVRAAGATAEPLPTVDQALARFGRMAAAEVAAVCDVPPSGPSPSSGAWRWTGGRAPTTRSTRVCGHPPETRRMLTPR